MPLLWASAARSFQAGESQGFKRAVLSESPGAVSEIEIRECFLRSAEGRAVLGSRMGSDVQTAFSRAAPALACTKSPLIVCSGHVICHFYFILSHFCVQKLSTNRFSVQKKIDPLKINCIDL